MSFNREILIEQGLEDVVLLEPSYLDEAIVGMSHDNRVIYDFDLLAKAYMEHDGMSLDEAIEWIDYNTIRSLPYVSNSPIVMYNVSNYV